jgi:hypothetical protein
VKVTEEFVKTDPGAGEVMGAGKVNAAAAAFI